MFVPVVDLHSLESGKRICQNAKPEDIKFLTYNTWRCRFLPTINDGVSSAVKNK